jgi:outer membrane protein
LPAREVFIDRAGGRIIFLKARDRALANFSIDDSWAPAAQVGVRYELDTAWMLNADVRYVPFSTHATGSLGGVPVRTSLDIDPILANVGVSYRF